MEIDAADPAEFARAKSIAKTHLQEASWSAVFAATTKRKEDLPE